MLNVIVLVLKTCEVCDLAYQNRLSRSYLAKDLEEGKLP